MSYNNTHSALMPQIPDWIAPRTRRLLDADPPVDESQFYGIVNKVVHAVFSETQYMSVPLRSIGVWTAEEGAKAEQEELIPTYVLHRCDVLGSGSGSSPHLPDEVLAVVDVKCPGFPIELAEKRVAAYCRCVREGGKVHEEFRVVLVHGERVYEYGIDGRRVDEEGGEGENRTCEPMKDLEVALRRLLRKVED
jgi:hypothetical protein